MPLAFHHLAIQVRDLPRAEQYYTRVLGLHVLRRWPWPPTDAGRAGERALWLGLAPAPAAASALGPAGFLALESCDALPRAPRPFRDPAAGLHLLALRIPAAERPLWEARLQAAGVEIVHRSAWTIYFQDPEGNRLGLSHHPEDEPDNAAEDAAAAPGGAGPGATPSGLS